MGEGVKQYGTKARSRFSRSQLDLMSIVEYKSDLERVFGVESTGCLSAWRWRRTVAIAMSGSGWGNSLAPAYQIRLTGAIPYLRLSRLITPTISFDDLSRVLARLALSPLSLGYESWMLLDSLVNSPTSGCRRQNRTCLEVRCLHSLSLSSFLTIFTGLNALSSLTWKGEKVHIREALSDFHEW